MASYHFCFNGVPAIFEELEIGLFQNRATDSVRPIRSIHSHLTWMKHRWYLSKLLQSFQICTVASEQERKLFIHNFSEHKNKVKVIPNCIAMRDYESIEVEPKPLNIIFTGSFQYHPNYEAMIWFVQHVFPKILKQVPKAQLMITGDHANLSLPSTSNITLTGYVEDIKRLISESWVSIAPLLSGGGTRLKILEAMALGTPVVSTSKGAEGLNVNHGEHLLIADSPEDFANHIISLIDDKSLRDRLATSARNLLKNKYTWEKVAYRLNRIAEQALMI
jgi:glycosyltransferase involved in cell wall biosynthesis